MKDGRSEMLAERKRAEQFLSRGQGRVHLMGICGVGMAGLAFHLQQRGFQVTGCDAACGGLGRWLAQAGIPVLPGHDPAHVAGMEAIIRSTAVRPDHPEIRAALQAGQPIFRRGLMLAAMLATERSVAVSGTHGKTTVATMLVHLLRQSGLKPAFCIGGLPLPGGQGVAGAGEIMVAEADESDGTLAAYAPDVAVITNIEFDHAEHFKDLAALRECFASLLNGTKSRVIFCAADPVARELCQGHPRAVSYGWDRAATWQAVDLEAAEMSMTFGVLRAGRELGRIRLPVPGRHNILNALAACAAAAEWGVTWEVMAAAWETFQPARRRFERIKVADDVQVISDYAHHPTEIAAVLASCRQLRRARWRAVFQPHRFTRTLALGPDFARVFEDLDELILTPVYAAAEPVLAGGTSWDLYAHIRQAARIKVQMASSLQQAWQYLRRNLLAGDGLLILGAGDVERIAAWAQRDLQEYGLAALNPIPAWQTALARLDLRATAWRTQEPLASKTTLQVGGAADIFMEIASVADLACVLQWAAAEGVPWTMLGAGSNALISDLGVRGLVIRLSGSILGGVQAAGPARIIAGAGAPLTTLLNWMAEQGRAGLEFLAGIPGTLGGALRMNAGAWGREIGELVEWVHCLDSAGREQVLGKNELDFGYRQCPSLAGRIILAAALASGPDEASAVRERIAAYLQRRAGMPAGRSAGSVFRNPPGDFAGRLLEQAGGQDYRVGGARVCARHANVIVTGRGATASDVSALLERLRAAVQGRWGVALQKEIVCFE